MSCAQAPIKLCVPTKAPTLDHDQRLDALRALVSPAVRLEIGFSIVTTSILGLRAAESIGGRKQQGLASLVLRTRRAGRGWPHGFTDTEMKLYFFFSFFPASRSVHKQGLGGSASRHLRWDWHLLCHGSISTENDLF